MIETDANIERVERINDHIQHVELAIDEPFPMLKPGQTLLVRTHDSYSPYLRQQWWPVNIRKRYVVFERPMTEHYTPPQTVSVIGPIGQPFKFRRTLRNVLLVAYNTAPTPLLMTIPWLLANKISVTLALQGDALDYDTQHLSPEVEIIRGDKIEFDWNDQLMTMGWADQVFVAVRPDDELLNFTNVLTRFRERKGINGVGKNYLFGVFQSILPCGVGACHACGLRALDKTSLVCLEGPSYDLTLVKLS